MKTKITILLGLFLLVFGFLFPYFSGISDFPSGYDFAAYYAEYQKYYTSGKLSDIISIWYEPGYFLHLNILDRMINDFEVSFIISEIVTLFLYFFSFYFLLGAYTHLSLTKKVIISFIFVFSLSQLIPFIFSLRKQYFCGVFLLVYFALLGKNFSKKAKIFLLGLVMSMIFFSHRGVAFYGVIFLVSLFIYRSQNKDFIRYILYSIFIGAVVNISYFIPFLIIQAHIMQDTVIAFINNIRVASNSSQSGSYLYRGFDMYQGKTDNTWVSYFFTDFIIFIYLVSFVRYMKKDRFFIYFIVLNLFIFFGSVMAGRLGQFANFFAILLLSKYLFRHKKILIVFFFLFITVFSIESFKRNMKNHYFYVIDEYLQNFYTQVPQKNSFLISISNPFIRYSGYLSYYSAEAILKDSYAVYQEKREISIMMKDFKSLFFLYGYDTVILPEYLKGYEIYLVFGYYTENYLSLEAKKYFLQNRIKSINFLNSPFFEQVPIQGVRSPLNIYGGQVPIKYVFRLKKGVSVKYVPNDEIVEESLNAIHALN